MTIGERIKKIRVFRKMTMDELGGALGFEGKNMSVRISQYETGTRIPGEDMILKLADALHCNYKAISDYSLGAAEDIIETLFWLEESATSLPARGKGTRFPEYTAPGNLIHLTAMTPAKPSETARPTYNEDDYDSSGSPVALTFEYGLVNDFLSEWCERCLWRLPIFLATGLSGTIWLVGHLLFLRFSKWRNFVWLRATVLL